MTGLVTFAPGWNMDLPAGTMLVRVDVVLNQRPGAGGFAAIIEASDLADTIIIRGGTPETTTTSMIRDMIVKVAAEIGGNRAILLTRSPPIGKAVKDTFKRFPMIRHLGNMPLAVADASRHAAVMAERAERTGEDQFDRLLEARYDPSEEYSANQDAGNVHKAIQDLISAVAHANVNDPHIATAAQSVLDTAEAHRQEKLKEALRAAAANDMPKRTKERRD